MPGAQGDECLAGGVLLLLPHGETSAEIIPRHGAAIGRAVRLDRKLVRQRFEERFSAARMAADYVNIYARMRKVRRLSFPTTRSTD